MPRPSGVSTCEPTRGTSRPSSWYCACSYRRQHFSLPQFPLIALGFRERPCIFAILTLTVSNCRNHEQQHSNLPHVPTPPTIAASSLTPSCRMSTRTVNFCPIRRTTSRTSVSSPAVYRTLSTARSKLYLIRTSFNRNLHWRATSSQVAAAIRTCCAFSLERARSCKVAHRTARGRRRSGAPPSCAGSSRSTRPNSDTPSQSSMHGSALCIASSAGTSAVTRVPSSNATIAVRNAVTSTSRFTPCRRPHPRMPRSPARFSQDANAYVPAPGCCTAPP